MTVRRLSLILAVLLTALFVAPAAFSAEGIAPLTWPQSFALAPGGHAAYGVPMAQAAEIAAQVDWTGAAIGIVIEDPLGNPVTPTAPFATTSARVSYTVSAAELQAKGPAWRVVISVPGRLTRAARAVATGRVTVQSPAASASQLRAISQALGGQRRTLDLASTPTRTLLSRLVKPTVTLSDALTQTQLLTTMSTRANTYGTSLTQLVSTSLRASALVTPVSLARTGAPLAPALRAPLVPLTLTSVTPGQARAGDQVVLIGRNLPTDPAQAQVGFSIAAGLNPAPGAIVSITATADGGQQYRVTVPGDAAATQSYAGQVYVAVPATGATTDSLPFQYLPAPVPSVTSTTPTAAEPGLMLRLDGSNFAPTSEVHFILSDGSDVGSPKVQFFSPQQLLAQVPTYSSRQPFVGQMYVANRAGGLVTRGGLFALAFQQTVPIIDGLSKTSGYSGDSILITGSGFRAPLEVHMLNESGGETNPQVVASDLYSVLIKVPDRVGVTNNCSYQISLRSGAVSSSSVAFTFLPTLDTIPLDLNLVDVRGQSVVAAAYYPPDLSSADHWDDNVVWQSSHSWTYKDTVISTQHNAGGAFGGGSGNDEYFSKGFTLRNGWVVDHIDFTLKDTGNKADSSIWESRIGTASPYVKVHWWSDACCNRTHYVMTIWIRGPRGVSYK